jgi:hypothetical protein
MTKASAKPRSGAKPPKRSKNKSSAAWASRKVDRATKHDRVLCLLRAKNGATIAAMSKATGWQPHSVRGFLAGVVKKKLGLTLTSEKTKSGRMYRIKSAKPSARPRAAVVKQEPGDA